MMLKLLVLFLFVNLITAQTINKEYFGTYNGQNVSIYTLQNNNGVAIKATDYGATLVSVKVPTGNGQEEILLGFDNLGDYLNHTAYFGGTIGRFANRIANSTFTYNNITYNLSKNDPDPIKGPNSLHGGRRGFDKLLWNVTLSSINTLKFELLSPDGDEGYPGNLYVTVLLSLTDDDEIIWTYEATTDKATPINLSNHGYWNLAGAGSGRNGIDGQTIQIPANYYVPVDPQYLIPTGEIKNVTGTPYDLTMSINIGEAINKTGGIDNCYAFQTSANIQNLSLAAIVTDPNSGRSLHIYTTQPAIQFYTGNMMDNSTKLANGQYTQKHGAFVFEPENYPDAPNHENFPNPFLQPNETYYHKNIYKLTYKLQTSSIQTITNQPSSAIALFRYNWYIYCILIIICHLIKYF